MKGLGSGWKVKSGASKNKELCAELVDVCFITPLFLLGVRNREPELQAAIHEYKRNRPDFNSAIEGRTQSFC